MKRNRLNLLARSFQFRSSVTGKNRPQMAGSEHDYYTKEFCQFMNQIDPHATCAYGCKWIAPYGYARNASCAEHDQGRCISQKSNCGMLWKYAIANPTRTTTI